MASDHIFITAQVEEKRPAAHDQAFLFLVFQAEQPFSPSARLPLSGVSRVRIGRSAERSIQRQPPDALAVGLSGRSISTVHAELRRDAGGWTLADLGSKNGTWLNGVRLREAPLADGDWIEIGGVFFRFRLALRDGAGAGLIDTEALTPPAPGLDTVLPEMEAELDKLALVARSAMPVLLVGEAGAGKEVAAREAHTLSGRSGPFVTVRCGALAPEEVVAELFGGAARGAAGAAGDRPGRWRSADRGTLFLEGIDALPPAAQEALARALHEHAGGARHAGAEPRLIASTQRDLAAMVEAGSFRGDLFACFSDFTVRLPPLRRRAEDLGLLVSTLLHLHFPAREQIAFSVDAARALLTHRWPLNIRELEKVLTTALVVAQGGAVERTHLPGDLAGARPSPAETGGDLPRSTPPALEPAGPPWMPRPGPSGGPGPALPTAPARPAAPVAAGPVPPRADAPGRPLPEQGGGLLEELKRRRVFRSAAAYGVLTFGLLQVVEPVMHGLHWPDAVLTYLVIGLAAGFPLVVVLSWIYDIRAGGVERTKPRPGSTPARRGKLALALLLLAVLAAAPILAWHFLRRPPVEPPAPALPAPPAPPAPALPAPPAPTAPALPAPPARPAPAP